MGAYRRKLKKGNRWRFVGSYLGTAYASKAIYLTKQEALKAERSKMEQIDREARRGKKDLTLLELMNEILDYTKQNQSGAYYNETKRAFKELIKFTGDTSVTNVKKSHIVKLHSQLAKYTNWTANKCLRIWKRLFYHAINVHEVEMRNPCAGVKFLSVEQRIKYIPTNREIEDILIRCNPAQQLLIAFVLETGCRVNEALRFKKSDIIGEEIVLYTRKSKNSNLTPRKVPKPYYPAEFHWKQYPRFLERKTKNKWGFHNLRHRFASYHHKRGMPLYLLMERLGHSNLSTTQIYLRSLPIFCPY